jgi:hypothetical protein
MHHYRHLGHLMRAGQRCLASSDVPQQQRLSSSVWVTASAAVEDIDAPGVPAFVNGCLTPDPSFDKVRAFSIEHNWKRLDERRTDRTGTLEGVWQIAVSGESRIMLRFSSLVRPNRDLLTCEVVFSDYRDSSKRIEAAFMEQIRLRPGAKLEFIQEAPDRKRLDYRDGPVVLTYYAGPLADPRQTPWVSLIVLIDRSGVRR